MNIDLAWLEMLISFRHKTTSNTDTARVSAASSLLRYVHAPKIFNHSTIHKDILFF